MAHIKYEALGNDLFAKIDCTCPQQKYVGTVLESILTNRLSITGYNDSYFFDTVNKERSIVACDCGKEYSIQWRRGYVDVELLNPTKNQPQQNETTTI